MKLLIIDTETGGLDPQLHSILSLGAVIWEDGFIHPDVFEVYIKEPVLHLTEGAMKVNKITLEKIFSEGLTPSDAILKFIEFVSKHDLKQNISLGGQNISFDIGFTKRLWLQYDFSRPGKPAFIPYEQMFSHRTIDILSITRFLMLAGRIKSESAGLDSICKYFDIPYTKDERHTALGDALLTAKVLTRLMEMVK